MGGPGSPKANRCARQSTNTQQQRVRHGTAVSASVFNLGVFRLLGPRPSFQVSGTCVRMCAMHTVFSARVNGRGSVFAGRQQAAKCIVLDQGSSPSTAVQGSCEPGSTSVKREAL